MNERTNGNAYWIIQYGKLVQRFTLCIIKDYLYENYANEFEMEILNIILA